MKRKRLTMREAVAPQDINKDTTETPRKDYEKIIDESNEVTKEREWETDSRDELNRVVPKTAKKNYVLGKAYNCLKIAENLFPKLSSEDVEERAGSFMHMPDSEIIATIGEIMAAKEEETISEEEVEVESEEEEKKEEAKKSKKSEEDEDEEEEEKEVESKKSEEDEDKKLEEAMEMEEEVAEEKKEDDLEEAKKSGMDEDAVLDTIFADFESDSSISDKQVETVAKIASKKKGVKKISSVLGVSSNDPKDEIQKLSEILDAE